MYQIIIAILLVVCLGLGYYVWKQSQDSSFTSSDKKYTEKELQAKLKQFEENNSNKSVSSEQEQELKQRLDQQNKLVLAELKIELADKVREEEKEMRKRTLELQEQINKKEQQLEEKLDKIDLEREKIEKIKDELRAIRDDLLVKRQDVEQKENELETKIQTKLEELAKITFTEAKTRVLDQSKEEMGHELISWQHKIVEQAEEDANKKAREIVAMAIQRCSSEVANEFTITTVKLNSEDDKAKIIGKAGRNIQWLEKTLGVEIVVDETPEVVTVSGFSSVRRHIAKRTLEKLLADGRVHPSSIEEMHEKAKAEIAQEIAEAGEWAVNELGIYDFPAKLIRMIGRLKFRTSYGQNMLRHSVEMAKLAGLLADEVNAAFPNRTTPVDKMVCIKGALLHDIGKAVDEETSPKGNHIELGEKICDMFELDWKIKKCISSHHDESYEDPERGMCIEAILVDACDNISGGRLGARKETAEAYFQRMEALEKVAQNTVGVTKSWIMRGSKEMWVFFDTETVSPARMNRIIRQISQDISSMVKTPVKIKVVGFYDKRVIEYAG